MQEFTDISAYGVASMYVAMELKSRFIITFTFIGKPYM